MGGDRAFSPSSLPSTGDVSSVEESDLPGISPKESAFFGECLSKGADDGTTDDDLNHRIASNSLDKYERLRRLSAYRKILINHNDMLVRSESLEDARSKILSYKPGDWIDKAGGRKLSDYKVPVTTSLILIGPRGSGKSSLVNKISRVFEDDIFASERVQVSYNNSSGDGTCFLQEYMIPRNSSSFCLCDTRSLSDNYFENLNVIKRWMTVGVRHGEMVIRDSDSASVRTSFKCRARQNGYCSSEIRKVNFVIFVVNGLSVLLSMGKVDESGAQHVHNIATAFNSPYLSFKDDKPVLVVTHGDLLTLSDRARVRVYLGEQLGIPPTTQIFDIPESSDPVTKLAIVDMLRYSLEHADRNLPENDWIMARVWHSLQACPYVQVHRPSLLTCMALLLILGSAIIVAHKRRVSRPRHHIGCHATWRLWLDE